MDISGKTKEGQIVVKGLFQLFDSRGVPLYIIFELCIENGWLPDWISFYKEAYKHGWKHTTIINRLSENMQDVYEPEFIDVVIGRLERIYGRKT